MIQQVLAQNLPFKKLPRTLSSLATPSCTWNGDSSLGDLLAQQTHALQLQDSLNLERHAVGPAADVFELPWMCSSGIPVLTVLSLKTTWVLFQWHQAGSSALARPADLEVAPGSEGVGRRRA